MAWACCRECDITDGKMLARLLGLKKDGVIVRYDGRERLWTVERFNPGQIKMETGQQVRMHVRNLLETAED